ncbi:hypothetical protein H4I96_07228 [Botrytis cinerea]
MLCLLYPFRTNSSDTAHSGFSNFSQTPTQGYMFLSRIRRQIQGAQRLIELQRVCLKIKSYMEISRAGLALLLILQSQRVSEIFVIQTLTISTKKADNMTEEAKKAYRSHRKNEAAKESDMKAEKKAKLPEKQRKYRGVPAGTKEFHEKAISLVKHAIECAKQAENLRDQMATDYIATEPSKKISRWDNLEDHKKAIDSFNTAETTSIAALNDRMKRVAVGDQEESDTDQEGSEQPRSGKGRAVVRDQEQSDTDQKGSKQPRSGRSETKLIKKGKGRAVVGDQEQSDTDQEGSKQPRSGRSETKLIKKGKGRAVVGDQEQSDTDQEGSKQPRSGRSGTKLIKKGKGRAVVGDQEQSDTDQEGSKQPRSSRSGTKLIKKGKGRAVVGDQEQSDTDQKGSKQPRSGRSGTKPSKKGKERPKNHSRTRGEH